MKKQQLLILVALVCTGISGASEPEGTERRDADASKPEGTEHGDSDTGESERSEHGDSDARRSEGAEHSDADADGKEHRDRPHKLEVNGWDVSLGVGLGTTDGALFVGEGERERGLVPLVDVSYRHDQFYFLLSNAQGLALGYTLLDGDNWTLDGVLSPKMAAYFQNANNNELQQLNDRDPDLHAGARLTWFGDNSALGVELSQDVSGTHDGIIASVDYHHEWHLQNWLINGGLAAAHLSGKTSNYYFGVSSNEASARFPAYSAKGGMLASASVSAEYPINERWVFHSQLGMLRLSDEFTSSPIIRDKNITTAVVGMKYTF